MRSVLINSQCLPGLRGDDGYQPCDSGDNAFIIDIAGTGIQLEHTENAQLIVAIWDVEHDFDYPGYCKRDTISISGRALTTPQQSLTGGIRLWSTAALSIDTALNSLVGRGSDK